MTDRRATNPVLTSDNRLKLGLFCTNTMPAMTTAPELYQLTWPSLLAVAREADDMGLEARVSTFGFSLTCVDGAIIAYADFAGELQRLRDDVLPILEESGLRQPHRPVSAAAPS